MKAAERKLRVLMVASNLDSLIIELQHAQVRRSVVTRTLSCLRVELPPLLHRALLETTTGASSSRSVRLALTSWRDAWLQQQRQ